MGVQNTSFHLFTATNGNIYDTKVHWWLSALSIKPLRQQKQEHKGSLKSTIG